MTMSEIRVVVVEDSLTIRKHMVQVLTSAPGIRVIGEAADGKAGIELCERLRPDVVTMDMMLPVMTGVAATEYIMAYCPTPILVVSASTNRGELFRTYDALAAGAVDVLEKAPSTDAEGSWERELVAAIRLVARVRVIMHPRGRLARLGRKSEVPSTTVVDALRSYGEPRVVALGASTGGPSALLTILRELPVDFPLPILLVLHISEPFAHAMAEWLDGQVGLEIRYAKHGERLPPPGRGCVLMASPNQHLEVADGCLRLSAERERHSCRPSVDVLFESLAKEMARHTVAGLLTGMGKDGAEGLLALRRGGALTIAQDEATSVVFGMPGEAVKLGAAVHVLPLAAFAQFLIRNAGAGSEVQRNETARDDHR